MKTGLSPRVYSSRTKGAQLENGVLLTSNGSILGKNSRGKTTWEAIILAESNNCIVVERNQYFPRNSIRVEFFKQSDHKTRYPWKGIEPYDHIAVDGKSNWNATWFYPEPSDAEAHIKGYLSSWKGVQVEI